MTLCGWLSGLNEPLRQLTLIDVTQKDIKRLLLLLITFHHAAGQFRQITGELLLR